MQVETMKLFGKCEQLSGDLFNNLALVVAGIVYDKPVFDILATARSLARGYNTTPKTPRLQLGVFLSDAAHEQGFSHGRGHELPTQLRASFSRLWLVCRSWPPPLGMTNQPPPNELGACSFSGS